MTSPQIHSDYFQVFDLPRRLSVEARALEKLFHARSRSLHPDKFALGTEAERTGATDASSQLNDAYRTLKDPWSRTEYLVALERDTLHKDRAREEGKPKAPPELLQEAFEMNMQLEELRMDSQDEALKNQLRESRDSFAAKMSALEEQLGVLWVRWDADVESGEAKDREAALQAMESLLDRRRYVRNLLRDANEALGE